MRLAALLKKLGKVRLDPDFAGVDISSLCCNSKEARPGALFVAIDGAKDKGSNYIDEAFKRGAACIVAQEARDIPASSRFPVILVDDARYALAAVADEFFGHPSGSLKVAGVTGTNGKTTITYLIKSILEEAGYSAGVIGTIGYSFRDKVIPASNTTPGPLELQGLLSRMSDAGCNYCVMEVSSHGLDQERVGGIEFKAAIFTNLTHDHLDYHMNMENYFLAKSKLFSGLANDAYAIINLDSRFSSRLKSLSRGKVIGYAIDSGADVRAFDLSLSMEGSEFILAYKNIKTKIRTALIGKHNVSNILAAIAFSLTQGIGLEAIKRALNNFPGVKGRLYRINSGQRNVFIDYAHTPDALENVLGTLRQLSENKLFVVFGCGGERDRLKRPLMGKIARKYADRVIITSDNPRSEEPETIAGDIARGIPSLGYEIILDRREAIEYALAESGPRDIVLIAGKGHENYQIFKDKRIEFDDSAAAEEYLRRPGEARG